MTDIREFEAALNAAEKILKACMVGTHAERAAFVLRTAPPGLLSPGLIKVLERCLATYGEPA